MPYKQVFFKFKNSFVKNGSLKSYMNLVIFTKNPLVWHVISMCYLFKLLSREFKSC